MTFTRRLIFNIFYDMTLSLMVASESCQTLGENGYFQLLII